MDGSNINLGNNFNQKDAEKKNISLRYFLHDYPALPRHTFTRRHQIFTGQADSNIRGAGWFRNLRQCTPVFLHRNGPVDRNQWGYHRLLSLVKHSRATENRFQHLVLSTQVRGYRLHIRYPCSPLPTYHFPPFRAAFSLRCHCSWKCSLPWKERKRKSVNHQQQPSSSSSSSVTVVV